MNIFGDSKHEWKDQHETVHWDGPDEETFAEEHAAAEAMREVDDEVAARLRGKAKCS